MRNNMGSPNFAVFHNIELLGFYLPPAMFWAALALIPYVLARRVMRLFGLYRFVWHPPLFNLALYVLIAGGVVLLLGRTWL